MVSMETDLEASEVSSVDAEDAEVKAAKAMGLRWAKTAAGEIPEKSLVGGDWNMFYFSIDC